MLETLIFDFGGVFLNLDKAATLQQLKAFGLENLSEDMLQKNREYEKGILSTEDFISFYAEKFEKTSPENLTAAWNAILLDFPEKRLKFIQELADSGNYKLILLSNTNDLHISWVKENIPFYKDFKNCFDKFYLSHEINFRKPDHSIYDFVLCENHLKPGETLFIDDSPENTEAAEQLGIHVWQLDPETEDVTDLFTVKAALF